MHGNGIVISLQCVAGKTISPPSIGNFLFYRNLHILEFFELKITPEVIQIVEKMPLLIVHGILCYTRKIARARNSILAPLKSTLTNYCCVIFLLFLGSSEQEVNVTDSSCLCAIIRRECKIITTVLAR